MTPTLHGNSSIGLKKKKDGGVGRRESQKFMLVAWVLLVGSQIFVH